MEAILKQPVVVDTKAGAGGQVGAQVAAIAKPDGYTLLSHNNGISGYAEVDKLFGRQPKTTRADFIPLARLIADPVLLARQRPAALQDAEGIRRRRKEEPGQHHLQLGRPLRRDASAGGAVRKGDRRPKLRHLPTNGGGPAITALLGNNAQVSTQAVSASSPHVKSGKLRAARMLRRDALEGAARRADHEGARLRR